MASVVKIRRVANPRRRRRNRPRVGRAKSSGRFVSLKRHHRRTAHGKFAKAKRHRRRASNPRRRVRVHRVKRVHRKRRITNSRRRRRVVNKLRIRRRVRRANPVLIELGAINPMRRRRKTKVARRRKRVHNRLRTRRRRHNRRHNPVAIHRRRRYTRRRRHNARRVHHYRRRRNPMGMAGGEMVTAAIGGLIGVAATKFLPTLIPASMLATLPSTPLISVLITVAGAFAAGFVADKVSPKWGKYVLFGGLMQTASAALNALAPPSLSGALALSGVGDIVPSGPLVMPNNNMRPMLVASPGGGGVGMVGASMRRQRGRYVATL